MPILIVAWFVAVGILLGTETIADAIDRNTDACSEGTN